MNIGNFIDAFPHKLVVSPTMDASLWRVESHYCFRADSAEVVNVDEGFITDFASVPVFMRWLIPQWGRYGRAAVIHDWLYTKGIQDVYSQCSEHSWRLHCDCIFKEAMEVSGVNPVVRELLYWSVRLFGWYAWTESRLNQFAGESKVSKMNREMLDSGEFIEHVPPSIVLSAWVMRKIEKWRLMK